MDGHPLEGAPRAVFGAARSPPSDCRRLPAAAAAPPAAAAGGRGGVLTAYYLLLVTSTCSRSWWTRCAAHSSNLRLKTSVAAVTSSSRETSK
eukprot:1849513-Prymnesium_polylepis.1